MATSEQADAVMEYLDLLCRLEHLGFVVKATVAKLRLAADHLSAVWFEKNTIDTPDLCWATPSHVSGIIAEYRKLWLETQQTWERIPLGLRHGLRQPK